MSWATWEQFSECNLANLSLLREAYRRGWAYVPAELCSDDYVTLKDVKGDRNRCTLERCWVIRNWGQLCRQEGWPIAYLVPAENAWSVQICFRDGQGLSQVGVKAVRGFVWAEDTAEGPTCVDAATVKFTLRADGHEVTVKALLDLVKEHLEEKSSYVF